MKISIVLSAALLLVWVVSCNNNHESTAKDMMAVAPEVATATSPPYKEKEEEIAGNVAGDSTGPAPQSPQSPGKPVSAVPNPDWNKKIIKNATVSVEVKDYKTFNESVRAFTHRSGGYIAQEEQNESGYKIENTMTIKVPVDQFDELLRALTPGQEKVMIKKVTSQDVTGEVVDTKSRLEAKRQVRLRYLDLLKQAKNMEEILQVQQEINEIQENMEAASGRINYLTHAASMSTIQLTFFQVLDLKANDTTDPSFGEKVLLALTNGLKWVGDLFVLLLTLWPLWMVLGAAWWGYKRLRAQGARGKVQETRDKVQGV